MSDAPGFFFKRTDTEFFAMTTIREIQADKRIKAAAPFTLPDMNKLMEEYFTIAPRVGSNHDSVAKRDRAGCSGDDLALPQCRCQTFMFRQRHPIDHKQANAGWITHPDPLGIGRIPLC